MLAASDQAANRERPLDAGGLMQRLSESLSRWDGGWYRAIVNSGYTNPDGTASSAVAFFPGFPLAVRWLSSALGLPDVHVGPAFSALCALIAGVLLYRVVKEQHGGEAPLWAVLFLFFAPSSIHLGAYYAESFFLALSLGCYSCAMHKRWWGVAILGAMATATRPTGFLLSAAILVNYWQDGSWKGQTPGAIIRPHVAIAMSALGALTYAGYLAHTFGSVGVYLRAQQTEWPRRFQLSTFFRMITDVESLTSASLQTMLQGFVPTMLAVIGTFWLLHLRRVGDAILVFGAIFLAVGGGTFESAQRYLLTLFPLYILLAMIPGLAVRCVVLAASATLMGYWSALFGGGWHFT